MADEFSTTQKAYITIEIITGVFSVVGNVIVLLALLKSPRLHTVANVFIGNLVLSDVAIGLIVPPLTAVTNMPIKFEFATCVLLNSLLLMTTNVSILMLATVAVDRYIAVKYPYVYERWLSAKRAMFINFVVWVIGLALGLLPMAGFNQHKYGSYEPCRFEKVMDMAFMVYFQCFGLTLIPLVLMAVTYTYVWKTAVRHRRRQSVCNRYVIGLDRPYRPSLIEELQDYMTPTKLFARVIFVYGLCWLPINIINTCNYFIPSRPFSYELVLIGVVLSHLNSAINPFIYAISNGEIMTEIKKLFGIKPWYEFEPSATTFHFTGSSELSKAGDRYAFDSNPPPYMSNEHLEPPGDEQPDTPAQDVGVLQGLLQFLLGGSEEKSEAGTKKEADNYIIPDVRSAANSPRPLSPRPTSPHHGVHETCI